MKLEEIQQRSRELFRIEASDLLRDLEAALLELEAAPENAALINRVFRVMHTLKGSGATSGFGDLSDFLHRVEDVYNAARDGRVQVSAGLVDRTLKIGDVVTRYLAAATPAEATAVLTGAGGELAALLAYLPAGGAAAAAPKAAAVATARTYHIVFRPKPELFRTGNDPAMFLADLRALGACQLTAHDDALPSLPELDPENCHLWWEIELTAAVDEAAIRDVFAFVESDCSLEIVARRPVAATAAAAAAPVAIWSVIFQLTPAAAAVPRALEMLWADLDALGRRTVIDAPAAEGSAPGAGTYRCTLETSGDEEAIRDAFMMLLDAQPQIARAAAAAVSVPAVEPGAPAPKVPAGPPSVPASETLRVSAERLDRLVNLVGELVILRSQVDNACALLPAVPPELRGAAESLQALSTEMRDVVLNIRMRPIEQTFAKFRRLVRDLSRDLGKEVELIVEGGETELDNTMLEALADPLMHLVRNSLDHGLELPEERTRLGKGSRGRLWLSAEQRGDRVHVTVRDDGRGLDVEKIRAKALRQGLLAPGATPTDHELHQLVFLPGFSTAAAVSQLSGRGVGLDVVRRQVDRLRGRVELRSEAGRGAEFRLSLPLTLAIIEGLLVEVDGERFVLPLSMARETIELKRAERTARNGRNLVSLRGSLVPYLRLRDVFDRSAGTPDLERVVIVELDEQRLGIAVDRVIGNHQTVLKSLGWIGHQVPVFSGSTVLGNGRVALVLDVPALVAHARARREAGEGLEV